MLELDNLIFFSYPYICYVRLSVGARHGGSTCNLKAKKPDGSFQMLNDPRISTAKNHQMTKSRETLSEQSQRLNLPSSH